MKYNDFVKETLDGVYNDFNSNHSYLFEQAKGIVFYKEKDGSIQIKSQSRLVGSSIRY